MFFDHSLSLFVQKIFKKMSNQKSFTYIETIFKSHLYDTETRSKAYSPLFHSHRVLFTRNCYNNQEMWLV